MDYELAKKLKDAGFPQGELVSNRFYHDKETRELTLIPTLSELIEACGSPFMLQFHTQGQWQAFEDTHTITLGKDGDGKTPEEAVANLWLALNKK